MYVHCKTINEENDLLSTETLECVPRFILLVIIQQYFILDKEYNYKPGPTWVMAITDGHHNNSYLQIGLPKAGSSLGSIGTK